MNADVVIKNGQCMVMKEKEILHWIAIKNGIIVGRGKNQEYSNFIHEDTQVIDAQGNTVLPGFIDSHFHVVLTALNIASVDLSSATTFEDIGEIIKRAALKSPGKHIRGIHLEVEKLKEKKLPTRGILDKYCNNSPVSLYSSDYQVTILNTCAMMYFKIPFATAGIEFDRKKVPTGIFKKEANAILFSNTLKLVDDECRKSVVLDMMSNLLSNGITTVNAMEGGRMCGSMDIDKDAEFIYKYGNEFPVDMELFYPTMDIEKIKAMGLKRIGGVLYIDGTIGERTAALSYPYEDAKGAKGILCINEEDLEEFVLKAYENKLQLALFTIGDRAIEVALNAHEYALKKTGIKNLRHRLEHVELVNESQMNRARELGLIFSMQPTYEILWGGAGKMYECRLGNRYKNTNPLREIIDSGVLICGGSDSDVTKPIPMLGIHAAVNHPVESHRVDIYEAIKMFTINGAYALFEENKKGTLEVGKVADIVILDRDILKTPLDSIDKIKVMTTIKSGEVLYNL